MKIKSIKIKNFKGIKELEHEFRKPITLLSGKVGTGKTSFIQGFRFALTNETPVKPIRSGEKSTEVSLLCDDDMVVERIIEVPNKKVTKVMGRKTGVAASESFLAESMNVSNEIMKIATSSEVLAAMKPSQFGTIFLNESVEKKTLDDLLEILANCELKEKTNVLNGFEKESEEGKLPPDVLSEIKALFKEKTFNLEAINKAHEEAKVIRKDRNAKLKISSSKSKDFLDIVKPEYTETEINKRYEEIIGVEKNVAAYRAQMNLYKKTVELKKDQDSRIAELDLAIAMNHATEPDLSVYNKLVEAKKKANESVVEQSKVAQTLLDNKKWFENTLVQLDKPVCPISEKLVCTTDKTCFKADLESKIKDIEISKAVVDNKIAAAREQVKEVEDKIADYNKNKENYNRKLNLLKEKKRLTDKPIEIPEKPDTLSLKSDYSAEKAQLKEKLDMLYEYKKVANEYKETLRLKRLCTVSDFIVKALDPKGPVIKEFIETFAEFLEDSCNERAQLLKTGFELKFIPEDGLTVLFKTGPGKDYLPYTSLSSGEKIFASLILTDLINSFYDSRVLILDDTDHLDADSFRLLMEFVDTSDITELYDIIIISFVEHDDTLKVAKDYDVDFIRM